MIAGTINEVIEVFEKLSPEDKEYTVDLLNRMSAESRRKEIRIEIDAGIQEYEEGKTKSFTNADDLIASLNADWLQ